MTMTNEMNLSALWNLPVQSEDIAVPRQAAELVAGSYVTTGNTRSPSMADGSYTNTSSRAISVDQSRGHYIVGTVAPSATAGSYISRH